MFLFSVVTLTYKNFTHLYETIDSVLSQSYGSIEYIISDDGSGNFPKEEIEQYIEKHKRSNLVSYKVIANEVNSGTVKNINIAYHQTSGDYVINLSCGDIFFSKNVLSRIADRSTASHCDMIVTSRVMYKNDLDPVAIFPHIFDRKKIARLTDKDEQYKKFLYSWVYGSVSGSIMCTSKKALESLGYFDETYRYWEDGPFVEKFLRRYTIEFAVDIISIWYEYGGISSGGKKGTVSILYPDNLLFNKTQRVSRLELFGFFGRRWIRFINLRAENAVSEHRSRLFLKYPIESFILCLQKARERLYHRYDQIYLKKLKNKLKRK